MGTSPSSRSFFLLGGQDVVRTDGRGPLPQSLGMRDLDVARPQNRLVKGLVKGEGDENPAVPGRQSGTDGSHGRCIGGGVHVDRFQQVDLVTLRVDDFVLAPLADIG
jgi:hypothetical protein